MHGSISNRGESTEAAEAGDEATDELGVKKKKKKKASILMAASCCSP